MIAHASPHTELPAGAEPGSRHAALTRAIAGIRVRRGARIPVEQILLGAAAILFPLGLIFILLGWYGAAHNGHTYAQIDYLISGGLFGLGMSVAGGFMYFGYWLSRQLGESRRQSAQTIQALNRIEELLDASLNSRVTSPPAAVPAGARSGNGSANGSAAGRRPRRPADQPTGEVPAVGAGSLLYATPRGNLLHRPECPVVARRADLRAVPAGADGFGFCTMCDAADALV